MGNLNPADLNIVPNLNIVTVVYSKIRTYSCFLVKGTTKIANTKVKVKEDHCTMIMPIAAENTDCNCNPSE